MTCSDKTMHGPWCEEPDSHQWIAQHVDRLSGRTTTRRCHIVRHQPTWTFELYVALRSSDFLASDRCTDKDIRRIGAHGIVSRSTMPTDDDIQAIMIHGHNSGDLCPSDVETAGLPYRDFSFMRSQAQRIVLWIHNTNVWWERKRGR